MELARKILDGLAHCVPETQVDAAMSCDTCPYNRDCHGNVGSILLPIEFVEDIRRFAKESLGRTLTM